MNVVFCPKWGTCYRKEVDDVTAAQWGRCRPVEPLKSTIDRWQWQLTALSLTKQVLTSSIAALDESGWAPRRAISTVDPVRSCGCGTARPAARPSARRFLLGSATAVRARCRSPAVQFGFYYYSGQLFYSWQLLILPAILRSFSHKPHVNFYLILDRV